MIKDTLETIGLAKNEAIIYELLLRHNRAHVSFMSKEGNINRRNVYDSLNRLIEKGLVFKVKGSRENYYVAVDPKKVLEKVEKKRRQVLEDLPVMESMYHSVPHENEVYIYEGVEGLRNIFRDILETKKTYYAFNPIGLWEVEGMEEEVKEFLSQAAKRKKKFKFIFNHSVKKCLPENIKLIDIKYRFLPKSYRASAITSIHGDHVGIYTEAVARRDQSDISQDSFTMIKNKNIADSYRTWFDFIWEFCEE